MSGHIYSVEERSWLISQDPSLSYKELCDIFNKHFNQDVHWYSIRRFFLKHTDIRRTGKKGYFKKGHEPFETCRKLPIGAEQIDTNGYVFIKITDDIPKGLSKNQIKAHQWKKKAHVVWEQYNDPIKSNEILIHLDGDKSNCSIENLYCITRRTHAIMAKNKWYSLSNIELTKTALKCAELIARVTEVQNGSKTK